MNTRNGSASRTFEVVYKRKIRHDKPTPAQARASAADHGRPAQGVLKLGGVGEPTGPLRVI